ncbi:hypothetical protein [Janthinobacterium sp. ROICE36]|uniref:hypothetical protein n=1 Tax=Janthinobacterium sp. ROICE36 TaxID=2048670 RepID=UPI0015E0BE76|nr:hypothetical protein [Janthinobacterium sp. ROICE36]
MTALKGSASAYFLRQLDYYGVEHGQLAPPAPRAQADPDSLVLAWEAPLSDLAPLRVERNHIAVFALRELTLAPGQQLRVQGPWQERALLLIETLTLAAGARLTLAMPTELVVDNCLCQDGEAHFLLAGQAGARGLDGVPGTDGAAGDGPGQQGGAGGYGGNANAGSNGSDSSSARITIACLHGNALFEITAGAGGEGGEGGRGGRGGQGWMDPATKKMTVGGRGGTGGAGGQGGAGGNGGQMQVWIAALAPGAGYSTVLTAARGGAGGAGGRGGIPGLGHPDGALGLRGMDGSAGADGALGRVEVHLV